MTREPTSGSSKLHAVIYCRVSTDEQAEKGVSLPAQESCCRAYCQRKGLRLQKVFLERGESGRTTNRPALQKMLIYCTKNRKTLNSIVVYKIDRLSRNKNAYFALQVHLRKYGINICSATEPLGDDSPIARLLEGILASVSEFESDLVSQRTSLSMEYARASGRIVHRPPLGYMMIKDENDRSIAVLDPARSGLVRMAFEMMATGSYSQAKVLRDITVLGLTTNRGIPVTIQSFRRMLTTRTYAGWVRISERKGYVRGIFEPLVSDETFERVQLILRMRRIHPRKYVQARRDFPLIRFVRCGVCGTPLTACWSRGRSKKYPYYKCRSKGCGFGSVRKEKLEKQFIDLLEAIKPSRQSMDLVLHELKTNEEGRETKLEERTRELRTMATVLLEQKTKLRSAFIYDSVIDQDAYDEEMERISMQLLEIQLELDELDSRCEDISSIAQRASTLLQSCDLLWELGSPGEKRNLQNALLPCGIEYTGYKWVRTAASESDIDICSVFSAKRERLATPTGFEPVLPA